MPPGRSAGPSREAPARRGAGGGRSRRWGPRIAGLIGLALLAAIAWFLISLFQPFHGSPRGRVVVVIPEGAGTHEIGSILARRGVVDSATFFDLRAMLEGKRSDLHSGRFVLARNMTYGAALSALETAPSPPPTVKITIPEGYTRIQIAQLAAAKGLKGSYLAASRRSKLLSLSRFGAPKDTPFLEGFLFPDTYELDAGAPAARLVEDQLEAFHEDVSGPLRGAARRLHRTPYEILTVASMVEREARLPRDRPKIAAVMYNRLRAGMPLGIDATVYYAIELKRHIPVYHGSLGEAQLHIDSPYNTRVRTGLPPTPIANPGAASIAAAESPAHVPYMYYVLEPSGCGGNRYSTTYSEFEEDVDAYDQALAENHGHLPTCRHGP